MLLGEGRVRSPRCGGWCSMHSPWPVRPHPHAVQAGYKPVSAAGRPLLRPGTSGPLAHPPEPAYPCYLPVLGDSLDDAARGAERETTRSGPRLRTVRMRLHCAHPTPEVEDAVRDKRQEGPRTVLGGTPEGLRCVLAGSTPHNRLRVTDPTTPGWPRGWAFRYIPFSLHVVVAAWSAWRIRLVAYGARLESVLGASPRGFESPILRHYPGI